MRADNNSFARFNPYVEDRYRAHFETPGGASDPAAHDAAQGDGQEPDTAAAPPPPGESLRALPPPDIAAPPPSAGAVAVPPAAAEPAPLPVPALAPAPAPNPAPAASSAHESAVDPAWLQQREAAFQAVRSDYEAARAAAQANVGGPGWHAATVYTDEGGGAQNASGRPMTFVADPNATPQVVSYDESGPVYGPQGGTWYEFDDAAFAAQYQFQAGAPLQNLAGLYGTDVPTLFAQHPELWTLATSDHALTDGPPPPGRAMGDATQLGMIDLYLVDPQVQALIQAYGGDVPPPTNNIGQEQVRLYGAERYAQMTRYTQAMTSVREQYSQAYADAQRHGGPGWIERPRVVMLSDEGGPAGPVVMTDESGAPLMDRVFDPSAFTEWYESQPGLANQAFKDFHGAAHLDDSSGHVQFERSEWYLLIEDQAARLFNRQWRPLDPGSPPRLNNDQAVGFDPSMGWVTPRDNVHQGTDLFEKFTETLVLGIASFGAYTFMGPAIAGGMGLTEATAMGVALTATGSVVSGVAAGGISAMVSGTINGNLSLKGVLQGALASGLSTGLLQTFGQAAAAYGAPGQIALRTTVQGGIQALIGGSFKDGAMSGFAAGLADFMAGTLNDSLKGTSPAEAASARSFSRIVVSAIRSAANPNDPNQAFAQALLGDVLGQAGQQDAAQMPQIPAPYVPPAPSPAAEPAETAEPAAPTEPPAPAETPPPVEAVPPGPVLPLTNTTLFDAAGHLQPGIVDTSAPTAVQAQQLADQLQQRGLTADEAASEAARYIGSSAASVPRDSAEPTAPEPLPPVTDDTAPGADGPQPSGPSDEPPRRVEIIGSKPVKDALGNIYQTDANGGQRIYLTNGSILILPPEQAATISVDQAGAGAAVLMDAALLSRLALVARAGVALVTLVNPVTLAIGATVVIGGTALYLWRSQSSDTVDLDSDTRFEQHPDEPFGTVYEKSADGDWEAMPGRFKLVQGAGRYMLLSEDEIARYGQPITTPAQPPGPSGPPALPVPVDPNVQMPGYPRDTPAIPPLEGSPAQPVSPDDLLIESRNSEELGRNLEAAGMPKPAPGYQPHHMAPVRAGGADMDAVRSKLATLGIDINDAVNGVWLPGASAEEVRGEPAYHPRLNNAEYNEAIVDAFRSVNTAEDAIRVLSDIRSQLQNGDFPGARPRPMPPSNRIQP